MQAKEAKEAKKAKHRQQGKKATDASQGGKASEGNQGSKSMQTMFFVSLCDSVSLLAGHCFSDFVFCVCACFYTFSPHG